VLEYRTREMENVALPSSLPHLCKEDFFVGYSIHVKESRISGAAEYRSCHPSLLSSFGSAANRDGEAGGCVPLGGAAKAPVTVE